MNNNELTKYWENYFQYCCQKIKESNDENNKSKDKFAPDFMIIKYIDMLEISSGERFLDYGCANCRIYPYIKDKFYKKISEEYESIKTNFEHKERGYYGIDIAETPLNYARNIYPELKEKLFLVKNNKIAFRDNFFDKILCIGVFDACEQNEVMYELLRVLNVNGKIIITGKNKDYFEDDEAAKIVENNARKKGHPNYFTDLRDLLFQLEKMDFVVENVDYFIRRGDFAYNKFQKILPKRFYEYAITIRKIENSKLTKFNKFSYELSNVF